MATASNQSHNSQKGHEEELAHRHLADFPPSLWGDHFNIFTLDSKVINSFVSPSGGDKWARAFRSRWPQLVEAYSKEIELLVKQVRNALIDGGITKSTEKMLLINTLERLGISYHFENEIEELLHQMFANFEEDLKDSDDLFNISLQFRIFRQHGYKVSSGVFKKFKGSDGNFNECLGEDVMGILNLYEAANLGTNVEDILDEALSFAKAQLRYMSQNLNLSPHLVKQVKHALKCCLHKGMPRLEARLYISFYEDDPSRDQILLRLAKVDYNLLQLLHKQELSQVARWGKDLDFEAKLPYTRNRVTESFFWAIAIYFEPYYSFGRLIITKVIFMITIIDDTYDAYGTSNELELFTNAVDKWDKNTVDLPEYMRQILVALINMVEELEMEMAKQGRSYVGHHLKEYFKRLVKAYRVEIEWLEKGYVPTMEEYFVNVLVASTEGIYTAAFIGMGDLAKSEIFQWLKAGPKIAIASSIYGRLLNDIAGNEEEQKRGHVASALECYTKQYGVSKEEATVELKKRIDEAWKDINEEMLRPTAVSMRLLMRILNFTRSLEIIYKDGDAFTHPEKLKDTIALLFIHPIPL